MNFMLNHAQQRSSEPGLSVGVAIAEFGGPDR